MPKVLSGSIRLFLSLLIILFLTSCARTSKLVPIKVSDHLLDPCPVPNRVRYTNRGLRQYAVDLHSALLKCNADKEAIKKELGQ